MYRICQQLNIPSDIEKNIEEKSQSMGDTNLTSLFCLHSNHTIEILETQPRGKCLSRTVEESGKSCEKHFKQTKLST